MASPQKTYATFAAFWKDISPSIKAKNYPTYHPCCRVWVGRFQTLLRRTHSSVMSWGQVVTKKNSVGAEQEEVLEAHMVENNWGPPVRVNVRCRANPPLHRREPPAELARMDSEEPIYSGAFHVHQPVTIHSSPGRPRAELQDLPPLMRRSSDTDPQKLEAMLDSQSQLYSAQ